MDYKLELPNCRIVRHGDRWHRFECLHCKCLFEALNVDGKTYLPCPECGQDTARMEESA